MRSAIPFVLLFVTQAFPATAQQTLRGFPSPLLPAQHQREQLARSIPNADTLRAQMRILSAEPHHAGSPGSLRVAERILERFRSYGLDARIERFEALLPMPVSRTLQLIAPDTFTASLKEPVLPEDRDSGDEGQLPTYNAYSPDGDVTADVVFVNYGLPEDYAVLDSLGIEVRGKIVLAKYGRSWRGIKPKVAAERGALATILYSDPRDDGFFVSDIYPAGPMRNWSGVQRGSVMDMPTYPGDPQSPGWASETGARKVPIDQVTIFSPIPVLPISYGDALPILRSLGGPLAPESWRGALPVTYHIGPGPSRVRLTLRFDWQVRPVYNVIARVNGSRWPDQWIVYGNHHDAWVNGAEDPISGMVALGETARAIGNLLKTGWRPARTLVFAAWDAEEWGLIGSTEWAEKHADELKEKAVAYLNSDTNNRGWLAASGSHSLETFVREIARDIHDPGRGQSVLDTHMQRAARSLPAGEETARFTIAALGAGSDYTAFLDHLGLASLHLNYGGEAQAGIYHSVYDSFEHYTRFMDTTFAYGVAEAQTMATAILRLADAPILPFEFGSVVTTYGEYVDQIEKGAREKTAMRALDLAGVRAALDRLRAAASRYEAAYTAAIALDARTMERNARTLADINRTLYRTERALTDSAGLENRPWFRHLIYAPGYYTGYGVKTMPGIREAVEDRPDAAVAQREAARVAEAIDRYAAEVARAAEGLEVLGRR
jgi:N-acetylated-alpha-linked acidic dipeptidase